MEEQVRHCCVMINYVMMISQTQEARAEQLVAGTTHKRGDFYGSSSIMNEGIEKSIKIYNYKNIIIIIKANVVDDGC